LKRISALRDLEKYGFSLLTGEACGLGLRILCDVSDAGRRLFIKAFGLSHETKLADPWNSYVGGARSVGSVMLGPDDYMTIGIFALLGAGCRTVYRFVPRQEVFDCNRMLVKALREQKMLMPPDNTTAAPLIENQWLECVRKLSEDALAVVPFGTMFSQDTLMGIEEGDAEYLEQYLERARRDGWTYFSYSTKGTAGDRNVHVMSGRVE